MAVAAGASVYDLSAATMAAAAGASVYDLSAVDIDGANISLGVYAGNVSLFVNVATASLPRDRKASPRVLLLSTRSSRCANETLKYPPSTKANGEISASAGSNATTVRLTSMSL